MAEFELGDSTYRIGKLDAFKQFHLSRKVAPIIPTLIPFFVKLKESRDAALGAGTSTSTSMSADLAAMGGLMTPFAEGIANMSDEAAEFILATCLGVVQRKQGNAWFAVWNAQQGTCMFDDLDLGVMIKLAFQVVKESLGPFMAGMLSGQGTPKA